jgi:hypothetical protein
VTVQDDLTLIREALRLADPDDSLDPSDVVYRAMVSDARKGLARVEARLVGLETLAETVAALRRHEGAGLVELSEAPIRELAATHREHLSVTDHLESEVDAALAVVRASQETQP